MFIVTVATDQQCPALHPADGSPSELVLAPTRCELGLGFGFLIIYENRRLEARDLLVFFG